MPRGLPQNCYIYTVGLPIDATGYKIWHDTPAGESSPRWFGSTDGNAASQRQAWIFNYSDDKALYE